MGNGTSIGRVRGLGSAKEGAHHFLRQRMTAATNLALMLWFFISIARLPGYGHADIVKWLSSPWTAVPLVLLVVSVFTHFRLGLQTVIEDYSHKENRFVLTILLNVFTAATAGVAIFSILKVAFGAAA